ncbi:MAG: rhamnulokinase [Vicinamibacterales bacterium]
MAARAFHAAVDLGAGSGRVFVGDVGPAAARLEEAHRFHYPPRPLDGHLRWDIAQLFDGLRNGLRLAADAAHAAGGELVAAGVDAWGVDYGLIDADGLLVEDPVCYRDERTSGLMDYVFARVPREAIFQATGIQFLQFNTLFQLAAHAREGLPPRVSRLLLMPDLCHHLLCGSLTCERTNASTTQLLNARTGEWDGELLSRAGWPRALMPDLVDAGTDLGELAPEPRRAFGLPSLRIVAPATHDTASAVVGTPLEPGWAYISSGTWSLVGVERDAPLVGEDVLRANFTNERGAGGTIRLLKNVMGLWVLESCRREWRAAGLDDDLPRLLARVTATPGVAPLIDPDAPRFFNPPSMLEELRAALAQNGHRAPDDPVFLTKVILDSLAARYASVVQTIEKLTGTRIPGVHVVGGGSQNDYLNQATANATGRPVVAGPVEAAALGNLLMQSLAYGKISSIAEGRRVIATSLALRRFEPSR